MTPKRKVYIRDSPIPHLLADAVVRYLEKHKDKKSEQTINKYQVK